MSVQFVVASKLVVSCVFLEPFLLCEGLDDAFFSLSLSPPSLGMSPSPAVSSPIYLELTHSPTPVPWP